MFHPHALRPRSRLILAFLVHGLLISGAASALLFHLADHLVLEEVQARHRLAAALVARGIDGDLHATIRFADEPAYMVLKRYLEDCRRQDPALRDVYTMRPGPARIWRFVVDAHPPQDPRYSPPGATYDVAQDPMLSEGLKHPSASRRPYSDPYGTWLSGYAPIRSADGTAVGVVGVDTYAATYQAQRQGLGLLSLMLFALGTALSTLFGHLFARPLRASLDTPAFLAAAPGPEPAPDRTPLPMELAEPSPAPSLPEPGTPDHPAEGPPSLVLASTAGARPAKRILVAEDHPVNQKVLAAHLRALGVEADFVADGAAAVQRVQEQAYPLVFMDCHMPGVDGFEATRRIRAAEGDGRRTPIVALTADAMVGVREQCLAVGMDDYLSKPYTQGQLSEMIRRWFRATPATIAPAPVDLSALREVIPDEDGMQEVIASFLTTSRELFQRMRAAVTGGDPGELREAAHSLKGTAGTFEAHELTPLCRMLERSAEQGDWEAIAQHLTAAEAAMARIEAYFHQAG